MKKQRDTFYPEKKMVRFFNKITRYWKRVLRRYFGEGDTADIVDRAKAEFLSMTSRLPDIGGNSNPFADTIIEAALILSYYKVLKERNRHVEEIGAITHDAIRERIASYPAILLRLRGKYMTSQFYQVKRKKQAMTSQRKEYPGNWVFSFREGDKKTFHYGIDFSECGICKLFESENAQEFTPYMCEIDYISFDAFGLHLHRTRTLTGGDDRCDFRFMK